MSAWAETTVKRRGDSYPPCEGDECGQCDRELRQGERVFRLTERGDEAWVCETCLSSPAGATGAPVDLDRKAGGVAEDLRDTGVDEWPFDDDPPDPL